MDVEHNKKVVRRLLDEVVGRGDMELIPELCTAEVVNHAAAPGRQHGTENLRAVLEFSRTAQPDQSWVEQHIVGNGISSWCTAADRAHGKPLHSVGWIRLRTCPSRSSSPTCSGSRTARSLSTGR